MKSELKEISPTQREIRVEIEPEAVREAYGRVSQRYAKRASIPGFRKGFAPLDVVRLRFKDEIKGDVLQEVIPKKVADAIREYKLQPLAEPHLHLDNQETVKVNGSEPLSLHVHVEVMPEMPEPNYKGIEVTRRVKPVEEGEIDDLIAERLQREAALIPVEGRKSDVGDTVIVDLEGRFENDPGAEPIRADDVEIVLGDEVIERSFTDNLIGVAEDEEKEFTVVYPKDFSSENLAGRTVHYKAKVKSVGRGEVPELNDEWAKSLDEGYESLADLKKRLRADLERLAETDADARLRNNAIAKLIEENAFEVPKTLIENQARRLLNDFAVDLERRGVVLQQLESQFIEMAYHNMRTQAERDVQGAMLLDRVAEIENVPVAEAEVDAEIEKIARVYNSTPDEVRSSLEKQGDGTGSIRNNLRTRKAIEAVVASAKITNGEWIDEAVGHVEETEGAETKETKPKKGKAKRSGEKS